jgi:hypothetical protein
VYALILLCRTGAAATWLGDRPQRRAAAPAGVPHGRPDTSVRLDRAPALGASQDADLGAGGSGGERHEPGRGIRRGLRGVSAVIRDDRELLAELARVNSDVTPFAMRVMDESVTAEEQRELAERLIDIGERLRQRADQTERAVERHVVAEAMPEAHSLGPHQEP